MLPRVNLVRGQHVDYMLFSTADHITNTLMRNGYYDNVLQEICKIFLDAISTPMVLDVGANLGAFSIPIGQHISAGRGVVHAFEPQRIIYYQLCGNVVLNRLDNVFAHHAAIGDEVGLINVPLVDYSNFSDIGAFSFVGQLRKTRDLGYYSTVEEPTQILTLDALNFSLPTSVIKIDVEGYELYVLKGAAGHLEKNSFPPIFLDIIQSDVIPEFKSLIQNYLSDLGYSLFHLFETNYLAQHPKFPIQINVEKNGYKLRGIRTR